MTSRAIRTATGTGVAVALAAVALGTGPAAVPAGLTAQGGVNLVDELVALAADVPLLEADDVLVADELTGGELLGSYLAAQDLIDDRHDDLVDLFAQADDAGGADAAAVAAAARGILLLGEAYGVLAEAAQTIPLYTYDEDDIFNGVDPDRGRLQMGWELYAEGIDRLGDAASTLVASDTISDEQRSALNTLLADLTEYDASAKPALHVLYSEYATQELLTSSRFDGLPGDATARSLTFACIPAGVLDDLLLTEDPEATVEAMIAFQTALLEGTITATDCPNLPDPEVPDLAVTLDDGDAG